MVKFPDGSAGCVIDGLVGCVPDGLVWCSRLFSFQMAKFDVFPWFRLMYSRWLSVLLMVQFDVLQKLSRMADIMLKLKIDPNFVEFGFGCKSLY